MKFKKNKIVQAFVLSTSLYASESFAIGTFDAALNMIMNNQIVQNTMQWAEEKGLTLAHMNQDTLLNMLKMQNDNALAAANLSRSSQLQVDMENLRKMEDQMPIDVCQEAVVQADIVENECNLEETSRQTMNKIIGSLIDETATAGDLDEQGVDPDVIAKALNNNRISEQSKALEECELPLTDPDIKVSNSGASEDKTKAATIDRPCARADLIGGSDGNQLTEAQTKAAEAAIALLSGKYTSASVPPQNKLNPAVKLNHLRDIGYRSLVTNSFNEILELRKPMDGKKGKSKLAAIDELVSSEFSSVEAIADMDTLNANTPAANIKYIAKVQRTMLYIQYLQFEQDLRMEALQAALLSLELDGKE